MLSPLLGTLGPLTLSQRVAAPAATPYAAHFTASTQRLTAAAHASLQRGTSDWTWGCWFRFTSAITSGERRITLMVKGDGIEPQYGYEVYGNPSVYQIHARVSKGAFDYVTATRSLTTSVHQTWQFLCARWSNSTRVITLNVSAQTAVTSPALASAPSNGTTSFQLFLPESSAEKDFAVDEAFLYRRYLSDADVVTEYNGGVPVPYSSMSTAMKTNLVSRWSLDEDGVTRVDSHGVNNLTQTGTVGRITGVS